MPRIDRLALLHDPLNKAFDRVAAVARWVQLQSLICLLILCQYRQLVLDLGDEVLKRRHMQRFLPRFQLVHRGRLVIGPDHDRKDAHNSGIRDLEHFRGFLLHEAARHIQVLPLTWVLREVADAGPAICRSDPNGQHQRHRLVIVDATVIDSYLLGRCRGHEAPFGEAAAAMLVALVEGDGKLRRAAHAPVQHQAGRQLHHPGHLRSDAFQVTVS